MASAEEPCIQISKDNVDHREVRVGNGVVANNGHTVVTIPGCVECIVDSPTVSSIGTSVSRFPLPVWDNLKPEPPRKQHHQFTTMSSPPQGATYP